MLFQDQEARDRYFERLSHGTQAVNYGDALGHARSCNLGLFGDSHALERDCAKVMVFELEKYHRELGEDAPFGYDHHDVISCASWSRAFRLARLEPDNRIENLCTEEFDSCKGREILRTELTRTEDREVGAAHVAVYRELEQRPVWL